MHTVASKASLLQTLLATFCRDFSGALVEKRADVKTGQDGRSRGFGIVQFAKAEDAAWAIDNLTGTELMGRAVSLRADSGGKGGGGGGGGGDSGDARQAEGDDPPPLGLTPDPLGVPLS